MNDALADVADDPFGALLAPDALYIGNTLQQRIDLIEHLLEFGRQLIVLSGPAGSGKTTLLSAIAAAAGQRWQCVQVQGGPALQSRTLLAQIADALDVDLAADSEPRMALTMLRLRLNVLERSGKMTVLLVDDADQLAPDAVAALVALARSDDQAAEARVLMAADQDHAGLLANLQRDRPQHGLVHVVEIPPLAETQVADFIEHRLGAAGLTLADHFGQADVQRIAVAAAGNPARVVALARQHYINRRAAREIGARRPKQRRSGGGPGLPAFKLPPLRDRRLLPLFLLPPLLALAAWWLLRDEEDAAPATVALELPASPATGAVPAAAPTLPPAEPPANAAPPVAEVPPEPRLAEGGDPELIEIVLPDEPFVPAPDAADSAPTLPPPAVPAPAPAPAPAAAPAPAPQPPGPAPSPAPAQASRPAAAPAAAPTRPPAPAPAVQAPKPTPKAAPPAPARPAAKAPAAPSAPVKGFSADWLMKQPRSAYTLQLAGVRDRASAMRFIQRHGLAAEATLLTTQRDGQAWYVLVHGYYPTRQAALDAAARLPAAVRKEVKPWARTIGDLAKLPR